MSIPFRISTFPLVLTMALAACGGGGGGGGTVQPDLAALPPSAPSGRTVVVSGVSQTATATHNGPIDTWSNHPASTNSNITLDLDGQGFLQGLSINTPQGSVSFGPGEIECNTVGGCTAFNASSVGTSFAALADANALGWNYQTYGVWLKDLSQDSFQAGAISVGEATLASRLPTNLTNAQFAGHASGFYLDGAGNLSTTDANMNALVNFASRTITFSTTGTLLTDRNTLARSANPGLDLNGNWSYGAGTSQFSGTVATQNGALSGNATGRFYGPAAEEIGGVYGLSSATDRSRMIGGFGGKR